MHNVGARGVVKGEGGPGREPSAHFLGSVCSPPACSVACLDLGRLQSPETYFQVELWMHVKVTWGWYPCCSQSPCPLIESRPLPETLGQPRVLLGLRSPGCMHLTYVKRTGLRREVSLIIAAEERQGQIP